MYLFKTLTLATSICVLSGCASSNIDTPSDSATIEINSKIAENEQIIKDYIAKCDSHGHCVPLGNYSWTKVREYWKKVPELQALRDRFEEVNKELSSFIDADPHYQEAKKKYEESEKTSEDKNILNKVRSRTYQRLKKDSEQYRTVRKEREQALIASNKETLLYMVEDFKKQGKPFPVDWLDPNSNKRLADRIRRLEIQTRKLQQMIKVLTIKQKNISENQSSQLPEPPANPQKTNSDEQGSKPSNVDNKKTPAERRKLLKQLRERSEMLQKKRKVKR